MPEKKVVPLEAIDLSDDTYRITAFPHLEALVSSMGRVGLLHSPLLEEVPDGSKYRLVSGYKRALAACELGWENLPALVCRPGERSPRDLLLENLFENLGTRVLNPVEKGLAIRKLQEIGSYSEDDILQEFLPLLGLGVNWQVLRHYQRLPQLEPDIQRLVAEEALSVELALQLLDLPPSDQRQFGQLVTRLRLGRNRQREILGLLRDLSRLESRSFEALLKEKTLSGILDDPTMAVPDKVLHLLQELRKRRYPRFSQVEAEFQSLQKSLRWPPNLQLHPPPFFEGENYRVEFRFRNVAEFTQSVEILQQTLQDPEVQTKLEQLTHL